MLLFVSDQAKNMSPEPPFLWWCILASVLLVLDEVRRHIQDLEGSDLDPAVEGYSGLSLANKDIGYWHCVLKHDGKILLSPISILRMYLFCRKYWPNPALLYTIDSIVVAQI